MSVQRYYFVWVSGQDFDTLARTKFGYCVSGILEEAMKHAEDISWDYDCVVCVSSYYASSLSELEIDESEKEIGLPKRATFEQFDNLHESDLFLVYFKGDVLVDKRGDYKSEI